MNTIQILKQLISIPSYVENTINEQKKADYIFTLLSSKKALIVKKQFVDKERYNIIVKDKYVPRILLAGHIDTVAPKNIESLSPKENNNKLYGLGSVDMLGGVASIIALMLNNETKGILCLFYVDEEYNFKGMRKFIEKYKKINAKLCIIPEPTNLSICNTHRGLIEVEYIIKGKTAHASRPNEGTNAIINCVNAVEKLKKTIKQFASQELGESTCCLSQIQGGLDIGSNGAILKLSTGSNSIPDICKVRLDIRPALPKLRAKQVDKIFKKIIKKTGCKIVYSNTFWDLGCLLMPRSLIQKPINQIKKVVANLGFLDSNQMGYGDGQMIYEKLGIPTFYFGPGPSNMCHKENEYVNIKDLDILDQVLLGMIKE